jgi:hypothetical protein
MNTEKFYNWEKMNITFIIHLMVKWFDFQSVQMEIRERPDVESGMWIDIKIEKHNPEGLWFVSAQRLDIVHRRLIEFLDRQNIREEYLKELNTKPE